MELTYLISTECNNLVSKNKKLNLVEPKLEVCFNPEKTWYI